MREAESRCVQEYAAKWWQERVPGACLQGSAVQSISHEGMSCCHEVSAYLMGTARTGLRRHQRKISQPQQNPPVGARVASFFAARRHARAAS